MVLKSNKSLDASATASIKQCVIFSLLSIYSHLQLVAKPVEILS